MKIQAIVSREQSHLISKQLGWLPPSANEVLVCIIASGICHTDATVIEGVLPMQYPTILGHEGSGIVEKVGSAVTTVKEGDHVVIGFASCHHCAPCLSGKNGACDNLAQLNFEGKNCYGLYVLKSEAGEDISQFFGQSSFAPYSIVHETSLIKVDSDIDLRYVGPLGCGIMTGSGSILNIMRPEVGSYLVVFGSGAVGLSALMAAKISGCNKIIAVDIHEERLDLAKTLGATHVINSSKEDVVEKIKSITNGGAHYSFETTGVDQVQLQAVNCLKNYGKMVAVAVSKSNITLNLTRDVIGRSITIRGGSEGDAMPQLFIPRLIEFWKLGKFPFDKLVKFYKPKDIEQAFADSKSGKTIKPILIFDESYEPSKLKAN